MADYEKVWQNVLSELEVSMSKANFSTWLKGTFIIDIKQKITYIAVPTGFAKSWLISKSYDEILNSIRKKNPEVEKLEFKVTTQKTDIEPELEEDYQQVQTIIPKKTKGPKKFKSKYCFKNFVVGANNKLAHAASLAVSEKPGKRYNPLFIWGGVGLGKTHLMHAIGNSITNKNPDKKILYVSSETFMNDYISAVQKGEGKANDFKNNYRNIDALLIDDIQFIAGKIGTQEEFFHTFNALHEKNKQIVISSDRPPKAIDLEDRLKSRCEWGMIVDISPPDFETRCAILKAKSEELNFNCPEEVIEYIAENVQDNIRELEGALNRLLAFLDLYKEEPTKTIAIQALSGIIKPKTQSLNLDKVINSVSDYFNINKEDIFSNLRSKEILLARQVSMYLIRHELNMSYPQIAKEIGKKDHTTIMHGVEKVTQEIKNNSVLQSQITDIKRSFYE